ncbi:hypothetical protein FKM82_029030 [Ascaphus truei]
MMQPNPETRQRRVKAIKSEEQAPLVQAPNSLSCDVILDGIDGPAAFLSAEVQDLGCKMHILSVGETCTDDELDMDPDRPSSGEGRPRPGSGEGRPRPGSNDLETPAESKRDLQEMLLERGILHSLNFDEDVSEEEEEGEEEEEEERSGRARPGSASSRKSLSDSGSTETSPLSPPGDVGEVGDLKEFVLRPAPRGVTVRCRISRDKKGMDRGLYPTYYMHLERDENRKVRKETGPEPSEDGGQGDNLKVREGEKHLVRGMDNHQQRGRGCQVRAWEPLVE